MVAASELAKMGFEVHVYESGRGVGGRMSTRRGEAPVSSPACSAPLTSIHDIWGLSVDSFVKVEAVFSI